MGEHLVRGGERSTVGQHLTLDLLLHLVLLLILLSSAASMVGQFIEGGKN